MIQIKIISGGSSTSDLENRVNSFLASLGNDSNFISICYTSTSYTERAMIAYKNEE